MWKRVVLREVDNKGRVVIREEGVTDEESCWGGGDDVEDVG